MDGPYKGLRGFGSTFTAGACRSWYIDKEGWKRWADDDSQVQEREPTYLYKAPPTSEQE